MSQSRASVFWPLLFASLWLASIAGADAKEPDAPAPAAQVVTLHDAQVFTLRRGDATRSLEERARRASRALADADADSDQVRVQLTGDVAGVLAGSTTIVELTQEDAVLAGAPSLAQHANGVAARVRDALGRERQRVSMANTVFSISLVVFFGLVTVYLIGKLQEFAARARAFVVAHPERVPALRLKSLDVIGAATVRNGFLLVMGVLRWGGVLGLAYAWLVLSLSLFESTRPYTETLTGLVLTPLSALVGRVAGALPLFAVVACAGAMVAVLVRSADLFFESVARGETKVNWIAPEVALAASAIVRAAIVLFAIVFAGPVITGDADGALSRTGAILLLALALAGTPLLASIIAGLHLVFSRGLRLGDRVEYGGQTGRVRELGLVVLSLEAEDGSLIRVPHARSLWHATRILERERA